MTPLEAYNIASNQLGTKIRAKTWTKWDYVYYGAGAWGSTLFNQDAHHCDLSIKEFMENEWELYEEPKPEILLTPEDVGRRVRWSDEVIETISAYDPHAGDNVNYQTVMRYFNAKGDSGGNVKIVEVYR